MNIPGHNQNLKPILIILAEPDHQPSTGFQASFPLLPLSTTCKPIYSIFEVLDSVIECIQPLDPWLSITAVACTVAAVPSIGIRTSTVSSSTPGVAAEPLAQCESILESLDWQKSETKSPNISINHQIFPYAPNLKCESKTNWQGSWLLVLIKLEPLPLFRTNFGKNDAAWEQMIKTSTKHPLSSRSLRLLSRKEGHTHLW